MDTRNNRGHSTWGWLVNTWAPLWSKVVDSSLWLEEDFVVKVFLTMIAKKDADHVVRGSAFNIAQWAKKTEAEVLDALKILSSPDTKRMEPQPYDGRRVERVEDGWLILNGQYYQNLMRTANRREYQREKQAEYRARKKGKPTAESAYCKADKNGDQRAMDDALDPP